MAQKKNSDEQRPAVSARKRSKARKHGYRGYGSPLAKGTAGTVHWGRGFTGVEPLGAGSGATLPEAGIISKDLKEKTSKS
jgi:hypothetical protein